MNLKTLADLFLDELKEIYHAEKHLAKALPKMAKSAATEELRQAFENHLEETLGQLDRLDEVFDSINKIPKAATRNAIFEVTREGKDLMRSQTELSVFDASLICAAQKAEYYEIAAYETLLAWARILGYDEAVPLLEKAVDHERASNDKLTRIVEDLNHADQLAHVTSH